VGSCKLCRWRRQCLVEDNIAGVRDAARRCDQDMEDGGGHWMVAKEAYIDCVGLQLSLVLARCDHHAGTAKNTQCVQGQQMTMPEAIW